MFFITILCLLAKDEKNLGLKSKFRKARQTELYIQLLVHFCLFLNNQYNFILQTP